jgi:hypothetical protein
MLSKEKMETNPFVRDAYNIAQKHGYKVIKFADGKDLHNVCSISDNY